MSAWEITKTALKIIGGVALLGGMIWLDKTTSDDTDDESFDELYRRKMMWYAMSDEERATCSPFDGLDYDLYDNIVMEEMMWNLKSDKERAEECPYDYIYRKDE